jgi:two-component system, NarL family, response regulator NreC
MARRIRILLIGKDNLMRDGLRASLREHDGLEVLAVLQSDAVAIESAIVTTTPDVGLMHLPVLTAHGLDAIAAVRKHWPNVRILALTSRLEGRVINAATEIGIEGYILESDSHTELLSAIRSVSRGERYLTPSISPQGVSESDKLTEREKEVMRLIGAGYRTREIAHRLSLSLKTVEKHRASLMRKLGLRSAAAVAAYAVAHGYLIV